MLWHLVDLEDFLIVIGWAYSANFLALITSLVTLHNMTMLVRFHNDSLVRISSTCYPFRVFLHFNEVLPLACGYSLDSEGMLQLILIVTRCLLLRVMPTLHVGPRVL